MKTEKIYLVVSSSGEYEDYRTLNHSAFKNPLDAEKEKQFIDEKSRYVPEFPFDFEEHEIWDKYEKGEVTPKEFKKYDEWSDIKNNAYDFNSAWVEEIDLL